MGDIYDESKLEDLLSLSALYKPYSPEGERLLMDGLHNPLLSDTGRSLDGRLVVLEATMGPKLDGGPPGTRLRPQ